MYNEEEDGYIPTNMVINIEDDTGGKQGVVVPFIFPDQEKNDKMFEFLANKKCNNKVKVKMLEDVFSNLKENMDTYVQYKEFHDADSNKANK